MLRSQPKLLRCAAPRAQGALRATSEEDECSRPKPQSRRAGGSRGRTRAAHRAPAHSRHHRTPRSGTTQCPRRRRSRRTSPFEISAQASASVLQSPCRHDSYRRLVVAHRMVVDRFDPNSHRSHRPDEPVGSAVVGLALVVIRAYRLLDIAAIESALRQPQQSVIGPYERLDRHGLNDRSSATLIPQALPDRMPGTRCRGPLAEIAAPRKGSPADIAANRRKPASPGAGRHRGAFQGAPSASGFSGGRTAPARRLRSERSQIWN
jgi:hypothetical protein